MTTANRSLVAILATAAGVAALTLAGALPAEAAKKKVKRNSSQYGTVTVQARSHPQESVTGAVRRGRWGEEVRLPGGSWISCKGDCRNTLREETVDFWERMEDKDRDGPTPRGR
jgi:hypothetical protein